MIGLFDTSIVIDIIRRHPPAYDRFAGRPDIGIPMVAYMETIAGARNKSALLYAANMLNLFDVIYLTSEDQICAAEQLRNLQLSHNVGLTD